MQRLGSQVLANTGSQHGAAVAEAGEWRLARPFQVQVPAAAIRRQLLPSNGARPSPGAGCSHRTGGPHARPGPPAACPAGAALATNNSHCASLTSPSPSSPSGARFRCSNLGPCSGCGATWAPSPRKFGGKSVDQLHGDEGCPCVCSCPLYTAVGSSGLTGSHDYSFQEKTMPKWVYTLPCCRLPGAIRPGGSRHRRRQGQIQWSVPPVMARMARQASRPTPTSRARTRPICSSR